MKVIVSCVMTCRHHLGTVLQALVDLLAVELQVLARLSVVREVERLAHVALAGLALRILAERVVEPAEIRQIRYVLDQRFDAQLERRLLRLAALGEALVDAARHVGERLDQVPEVAACIVDVDLHEDRVARGLVDLDVVVVGEQRLELRAVHPGIAA
jgi:hypothetical protein